MACFLRRAYPDPEDEVILYQYASTAAPIDDHAHRFIKFLAYATEAAEVHFVAHSLGNIVLRRAFQMAKEQLWQPPRLGKHVMLGPPNQGAQIAARLQGCLPVCWFTGAPFLQLGRDWSSLETQLATPPCPFGIIAGRLRLLEHRHPFIQGPNDFIVSVDETRLAGSSDFLVVRVPHNWLMNSRQVHAATLSFLKWSRFSAQEAALPRSVSNHLSVG
jgi:hypothetical protein